MQPVQDLTLDDTVSRTQYQFTLQASDADALSTWAPKLVSAAAAAARIWPMSPATRRTTDLPPTSRRPGHAARFGISVGTVDNALYDAFGQRIVSTIFTQSNQYRVIIEADPRLQNSLARAPSLYLPSAAGGQVPLSAIAKVRGADATAADQSSGAVSATTVSFNLARAPRSARRSMRSRTPSAARHAGEHHDHLPGRGARVPQQSVNELLLLLAAVVVMYIVLGVLYESFIHPITILSTLPSAGIGALLALISAAMI
jgi:multidrug efflux pump